MLLVAWVVAGHYLALKLSSFNEMCSLCAQDEQNGYLRIATTSKEQIECITSDSRKGDIRNMLQLWCKWRVVANATSQLTVLCLPDGENKRMEEVATVGDLGVTEEIKSVQFFDDKVFIVTFLRTDPLYGIDLTNPEKPFLAGELKIKVRLSLDTERFVIYAEGQNRYDDIQQTLTLSLQFYLKRDFRGICMSILQMTEAW